MLIFEEKYGFKKAILTTSGTDALEMAAILCDVQPGDEVIVPSYTFVSTALAFIRQGAKIVFADSCENNPNIDADKITVIEAQSLGTPVLGARIGGIPELIKNLTPNPSPKGEGSERNGEDMVSNGMTFESGNVEDLKKKIQAMWDASWDYEAIAQQAQERYSSEAYYEQLMKYYQTKVL